MTTNLIGAVILFILALALTYYRDRLSLIASGLANVAGWITLIEAWAMMT